MKCTIPEISWHNREPVLSVDIHPISNDFYKLASGGGDSHILIWQMVLCENGSVKQEVISDLTRHQKSVNTVRWSSSGQYLASGDDDANIIVWQLKNDNIPSLEANDEDKETWIVYKILRGHKEDIYDLCWSMDNMKLFSGSIDNTAILWDLTKGKMDHIISDHKGFVQGVAWDPKNQILASISTDRICRIFDITGKQVKSRIHKGKLPVPPDHFFHDKESKFFHDDTFKSFFRRLQFTPDGSLLIVPSGHFQVDDCKKSVNSTLVFTLDNWTEPAAVLPHDHQSSTVVRCCPLLFHNRDDGPEPLVKLPYRLVFAVGTDHDIILYDTQQTKPFARFHEIHYTRITDLTWSADGTLLIASSTDGFCSLITFEPEELGKVYPKEETDEEVNNLDCNDSAEVPDKDENVDITNKNVKEDVKEVIKKRPSFIQKWVQNTPKKVKLDKRDSSNSREVVEIEYEDDEPEELPKDIKEEINKLIPRRVTPKTVQEDVCAKSGAKLIEVRRKPREVDSNKEYKCKEVKTETKEINKLVPRRITPKKVGEHSSAKPIEGKKSKENEAKPIPVRRKLNEDTNTEDNKNDQSSSQKLKGVNETKVKSEESKDADTELLKTDSEGGKMDADKEVCDKKIEEISKKPEKCNKIDENQLSTMVGEIIVLDEDSEDVEITTEPSKSENSGAPSNKTIENTEQKKQINTKCGKKRHMITEDKSKKTPSNEKNTSILPQINKVNRNSPSDQNSSSSKRKNPKIKVGSLVPNKLSTTPVKSNTLLDFLKISGEKKKKKAEVKSQQKINLTLDEDEARDGFAKDILKDVSGGPDAVPLEEDCTEDFCLQLEDTQDDKVANIISCGKMEVEETVDDNKQVNSVVEISDESCSPKQKKVEENLVPRKPRRVSLITLASPKGKKKHVTENDKKE